MHFSNLRHPRPGVLTARRLPLLTLAATVVVLGSGCGIAQAKTIKATNGVTIPSHPTRIVSLSPSATNDLYAVGAGRQVIAVDQYSTYPSNTPIKKNLNGWSPNAEAIASYKPDLVIVYNNENQIEGQLAKLKIPVQVERAPIKLSGAYTQLANIGTITAHRKSGAAAVKQLKRQVNTIAASAKKPGKTLKVYLEVYEPDNWAATSKTFLGGMLSRFHLKNIADGGAQGQEYPELNSEYIVSHNPNVIFTSDGQSLKQVGSRPAWSGIWAVKHKDVFALNESVGSEWGPHSILPFMRTLAADVKHVEKQL
jgi:iron complex transport system substrate-binding protein